MSDKISLRMVMWAAGKLGQRDGEADAIAATALEALVRLVGAGKAIQSFEAAMGNPALARGWCDEGEAFNAALAQFIDDREKKP